MKLRYILITLFLILGIIPLLTISIVGLNELKADLQQEIQKELVTIAEAKEGSVFAYFDSLEGRTIDFSSDGFIRDSLKEIASSGSIETVEALNEHLINNKKNLDDSIIGILVIGRDGTIVAATDEAEIGKNESDDEYFIEGKNDLFLSSLAGEEHLGGNKELVVSAPLTDKESGELLGVLVNIFDGQKLSGILSGEFQLSRGALTGLETGGRKTLKVHMADKNKKLFIHPLSENPQQYADDQISDTLPVQKCLENNEEIVDVYTNYAGEEVLGASMCIVDEGWTLLVEMDTEEAFAPINKAYRRLIILTSIIALLIIIISLGFVRIITGPINTLSATVDEISKGNFEVDIQKGSFFDEIVFLQRSLNRIIVSMKLAIFKTKERKDKESNKRNSNQV